MVEENIFLTDSLELKKVDVKDLQLGMYVSELDRPWVETNFLFQGFELKTSSDITEVQSHCAYVFIDVVKSRNIQQKTNTISSRNTAYSKGWLEQRKPATKKNKLY